MCHVDAIGLDKNVKLVCKHAFRFVPTQKGLGGWRVRERLSVKLLAACRLAVWRQGTQHTENRQRNATRALR